MHSGRTMGIHTSKDTALSNSNGLSTGARIRDYGYCKTDQLASRRLSMICNAGHLITFDYYPNRTEWYCTCSKGSRSLSLHREEQDTIAYNMAHTGYRQPINHATGPIHGPTTKDNPIKVLTAAYRVNSLA